MKLRNIFLSILACLAFVSCENAIEFNTLAELKVSESYISINKDGGSASIQLTATESWSFDQTSIPDWLTINPVSGGAGDYTVTFSAEATTKTRKAADLAINVAGKAQLVNVEQSIGIVPVSNATCAEVIAGADGKTYRVKGVCTSIANTQYGNWYLTDETGEVYIYGTLDKNGGTQNFLSLGIEVGDVVTVEGPKTTYNGTIELVDVTVVSLEKSLISAVDKEVTAPKDGGITDIKLICKGNGVNFNLPEDAASWLNVKAITPGEGDTTIVSLFVAPNEAGARTTTLEFTTTSGGKTYSTQTTLSQEGSIIDCTVAAFKAAPVSTTLYRLTGKVVNIASTTYGNFYLVDATDTVYVYGLTATKVASNDKSFSTLGIVEGDKVTIIGTRTEYKGTVQVGGPAYHESHVGSTVATVAEFNAAAVGSKYYKLTGVVSDIATGDYGNFNLTDETGTVYVYGLTLAPVAKNDKSFPKLGIHNGDKVVIIGTRAEYNGAIQVGGPAYHLTTIHAEN